jgi:hypothetical protein
MYLALEHKPDNGGEIHNLAKVALAIMFRLKICKKCHGIECLAGNTADDSQDKVGDKVDNAKNLGRVTEVFVELAWPYLNTGRLVTVDKYFASVKCTLVPT